jgi:bla regulator protein BlaR1
MSPFLHFAVWGLLIARLLIPVTLESSVHLVVIPTEINGETTQQAHTPVTGTDAALNANPLSANEAQPQKSTIRQAADEPTASTATQSTVADEKGIPFSTEEILLAVWLTGAGIGLIYLASLYALLRRRIQKDAQAPSKRLLELFAEVRAELNIKRDVNIIGQCEYGTPAVMFPGTVLMPINTLVSMSDEEVKLVLRHELMHFKRRDHILGLVLSVLNAVYWFNPVVWFAFKQIRADMETACDSDVVRYFDSDEKTTYAAIILSLFSKKQYGSLVLGMVQGNTRKIAEKRIRGVFMNRKSNHRVKITAVL